jgi:hypothetical protein
VNAAASCNCMSGIGHCLLGFIHPRDVCSTPGHIRWSEPVTFNKLQVHSNCVMSSNIGGSGMEESTKKMVNDFFQVETNM